MTRPTIPPRHSASAEAAKRFREERDARLTPEQREAQERELRQACEELARMRAMVLCDTKEKTDV